MELVSQKKQKKVVQGAPPLRAPATLAARQAAVWALGYLSGAPRPGAAAAYPGCAVWAIRPHLELPSK